MRRKRGIIMSSEQQLEEDHLNYCLSIIKQNIHSLEEKESEYKETVKELFQSIKKGEGDSYGQLLAGQNILADAQNTLRKNRSALNKTYFGRIDYEDKTFETTSTCYIGKNGIMENQTDVLIVDWRAPVASVYYENELGDGSYFVPNGEQVEIHLQKKRTYDIAKGTLLGFYDDDVASNDELLIKYLSQNKEAVLGDIIATIQKEQNEIIRDVPYKNIIVQGVAGSGKTTVALHRISYLLYNYEDRYKPSEFCIVGSNDMLLNYISSGLPELDVNHVRQMRMDLFLPYLMGKAWKKKYKQIPEQFDAPYKSKLSFVKQLEQFLDDWKHTHLPIQEVRDPQVGLLLSKEMMEETLRNSASCSLLQLEKLLNAKIATRIKFLCVEEKEKYKKDKLKQYKKYFDSEQYKWTEPFLYEQFLNWKLEQQEKASELFSHTKNAIQKSQFDIYDVASLALIWKRILLKKETDEFSQIIIDEAQDFGEMIYYVLKQLLPNCYFTIMGDVSQNIRYETGMNDWEGLKEALFSKESDSFYLLSKSYRNTIEISQCAGKVLEKASQGSYKIEPVIRHGAPVQFIKLNEQEETSSTPAENKFIETVRELSSKGYETIAIVCRTEQETEEVKELLAKSHIPISNHDTNNTEEESDFQNGIMVLPVSLTKGLEFDAVLLWNADENHYGNNKKEAKLLYVAITRALHELYAFTKEEFSSLFS